MYKDRRNMEELLRVESVRKQFSVKSRKYLKAVDGVSFAVKDSQVFGMVGESGCGKSTIARLIVKLMEPTSGRILFEGTDIGKADKKTLKKIRKRLQIIFQDPLASLNPRKRIADTIGEALIINDMVEKKSELTERVLKLLLWVGLDADTLNKYPHEFSGGQRQRICIARALAVNPKLIVADEPLSALDVSIQAQILNLLEDLQRETDLAYFFISHDLHVIEHFCDEVAVMYLGKVVELSGTDMLFQKPLHPYTEALLSAVPNPEIKDRKHMRIMLKGDVPSPLQIPPGCPFHTRCHRRFQPCDSRVPVYREVKTGRWVSCHLHS
jgi:oligopeptide/dipeptide ABC transporter ATP-binding protein